jgi:hypothetical protein
MKKTMILGIVLFDRIKEAGRTQETLTRHAGIIRSRLGFHELSVAVCSRIGTILLVVNGTEDQIRQLEEDLYGIGGIEVKKMTFDHLNK